MQGMDRDVDVQLLLLVCLSSSAGGGVYLNACIALGVPHLRRHHVSSLGDELDQMTMDQVHVGRWDGSETAEGADYVLDHGPM